MSAAQHLKVAFETPTFIVNSYLGDLSDEELLVRPVEGANHIKWQLGHLVNAEHSLIEMVRPGSMPALPEGFGGRYSKETAAIDDPQQFDSKADLLKLMEEQRAGTLAALEKLSDEELSEPAPEKIAKFGRTLFAVFAGQTMHWMMHAGQWAVIRRKLGREPLF